MLMAIPDQQRLDEIHGIIMRETQLADDAGIAPPYVILQPLYAEQNARGIDLSQKVYRLLEVDHLCGDIRAGHMTMANIGPLVWNDKLENVLRDATFPDGNGPGTIEIRSLMDSYYAVCWTDRPESRDAWRDFGKQPTKVRIESTVGQLLAALMQRGDHFCSLRFHAGLVKYRLPAELIRWPSEITLDDLLDSTGKKLAQALAVVQNTFAKQREVRIIYNHLDQDKWTQANVTHASHPATLTGLARVPCRWDDVINSITVRSNFPAAAETVLANTLASAGLNVPVGTSKYV
jgi:hypothetical protein